ncbi:MAG: ABC transporter ATP-binding protein [Myxococcota bacterium]
MNDALDVEGLRKVYGSWWGAGRTALDGVSLSVPRGAMFGLIGPNGAGKTTFIKLLLGIIRPTAGQVRIMGKDPSKPRSRRKVGYLPERLYVPPAFTLEEFLYSVARLKGVAAADALTQMERVGLADERRTRVGRFSKGMRQRAGLAAALTGQPDLLILDEPTDGIDPLGRKAVRLILRDERSRGATVLLNSHLLDETERLCDRIAILDRGRLVRQGSLDTLALDAGTWRLRTAAPMPTELKEGLIGMPGESNLYEFSAASPEAANEMLDRFRSQGVVIVEFSQALRPLEAILEEALT